ncbi:MAG: rRNA maturation RNase YbeY [Thermodesulfovibrionales bacterium]|nr:rRNA maturation RNase YbeY [Thermodesulfovibrionales bacterium]
MEILITNKQRLIKINQQKLKKLIYKIIEILISENKGLKRNHIHILREKKSSLELSLCFVNDKKIRQINLEHRHKDKPTDVLSFPQLSINDVILTTTSNVPFPLGDIVINVYQAQRQSQRFNSTLQEELLRLLIHGLLHLLGFDHEKNYYARKKMKNIENFLYDKVKGENFLN